MVHQYKNNGYDIVLDVNSGAIHVVDDVTYDVIALYEGHTREEIVNSLRERYPETEVEEALDEVQMLRCICASERVANTSAEEIVTALSGKYGKEEVEEAIDEKFRH